MQALVDLAPLLSPDRVLRLPPACNRHAAISMLADLVMADRTMHDRVAFVRAALEREDVTSTAIGGGVALPHARSQVLDRCRIALGLCPEGLDWQAPDLHPVRVAVLLAARDADHTEHLRVMATLAMRLRRPGIAETLCCAPSAEAAIAGLVA
jgi:mannitol/fructose-specific phosphotransferase system IIA component (Ntr-type)